tara:strand:- start:1792 stop:2232 length:441 start_codon:yes stop_codon:yes gene_type:complete
MADRKPVEVKTRDSNARTVSYRPYTEAVLPDPRNDPDHDYKYIRTSILGKDDARNVITKRSMGYEPCKLEDHPEIPIYGKTTGEVEIGGLMLHKIPKGWVEGRSQHINQKTQDQAAAVDVNYKRQNDPRMPMFADKKSTTTKGSRG